MLTSINPSTDEPLGEIDVATPEMVRQAVATARQAQPDWGARTLEHRCQLLARVQQAILTRQDEIAALLVKEQGKRRSEAFFQEVLPSVALIHYYRKNAARILAPEPIPLSLTLSPHRASYLHWVPRGVAAVISPWNYPFSIACGGVSTALIAGNAVVLKPSEHTPLVGDLLRDIFLSAGLPGSLLQVVHGAGPTGAALLDARPDHVEFTGSVATGRLVAGRCGELLVPCTMELGGKAPALVLPDADLERTANALVWGAFANCGQACASVERALVHESVLEPLTQKLVEKIAALKPGEQLGPLTTAAQRDHVVEQVADALAKGATLLAGGHSVDGPGFFHEATLLGGCTPEMAVVSQETFGPVLPLIPCSDVDSMISEANRLSLGLLAYVFSADRKAARRLGERIRAGTVMVNDVLNSYALTETPWAGMRDSGLGQVHGDEGLRGLCEQRHVNHDVLPTLSRDPWWFPYDESRLGMWKRMLGLLYGRRR